MKSMHRCVFLVIIISFLAASALFSEEVENAEPVNQTAVFMEARHPPRPFSIWEVFTRYDITYNAIGVGTLQGDNGAISSVAFHIPATSISQWYRDRFIANNSQATFSVGYKKLSVGDLFPLPNGLFCKVVSIDSSKKSFELQMTKSQLRVKSKENANQLVVPISPTLQNKSQLLPDSHFNEKAFATLTDIFTIAAYASNEVTRINDRPVIYLKVRSDNKALLPRDAENAQFDSSIPVSTIKTYEGGLVTVLGYGFQIRSVILPEPDKQKYGALVLDPTPISLGNPRLDKHFIVNP